ncbi:MAG: BON domain-containing protein [Gemmatales bacterium]|nr:BON domain-containing protein [Gemmatales bacterium]MDW8385681.1 BON domain-containing protein [Gemmatales bacterium]
MNREGSRVRPLLLLLGLLVCLGCSEQEVKKIERVTGKAWDKARQASAQIGAELGLDADTWKQTRNRLTLPRLIEERLRQDASLRGASIRVQIENDQIVLTGTVREETQRLRALELARSVPGGESVRDNLRVIGD